MNRLRRCVTDPVTVTVYATVDRLRGPYKPGELCSRAILLCVGLESALGEASDLAEDVIGSDH